MQCVHRRILNAFDQNLKCAITHLLEIMLHRPKLKGVAGQRNAIGVVYFSRDGVG